MYEKLFEQSERVFKPFGEIWALQAQAAETLAKKQTSVLTDVWNQGVLALQNLPGQKSVEEVFKLQQSYWENLQDSLQELFGSTQDVVLETNRKISAVLQKSSDSAATTWAKAAVTPTPIKSASAPVKKPAAPAAKKPTPPVKPAVVAAKSVTKTAANLAGKATAASGKAATAKPEIKTDAKAAEVQKGAAPEKAPKTDLLI